MVVQAMVIAVGDSDFDFRKNCYVANSDPIRRRYEYLSPLQFPDFDYRDINIGASYRRPPFHKCHMPLWLQSPLSR